MVTFAILIILALLASAISVYVPLASHGHVDALLVGNFTLNFLMLGYKPLWSI